MIVYTSKAEITLFLNEKRNEKLTIGFVPTMGALHKGHLSLIDKAKSECNIVVCSIFVNPTQFNNLDDLTNYPRTLDQDLKLLQAVNCDVVFAPEIVEMYSANELELKKQKIDDLGWTGGKTVNFGNLEKVMEGEHRPGHFNGVAQVVSKLFTIVKPDKAYFGQKDFQQLAIIKSMVKQLMLPIEIIGCPIVREKNGLAMSSRNERLLTNERAQAGLIYETLCSVEHLYKKMSVGELKKLVKEKIANSSFKFEYFEIANCDTLQPFKDNEIASNAVACIALYVGPVRLIDNIVLN